MLALAMILGGTAWLLAPRVGDGGGVEALEARLVDQLHAQGPVVVIRWI